MVATSSSSVNAGFSKTAVSSDGVLLDVGGVCFWIVAKTANKKRRHKFAPNKKVIFGTFWGSTWTQRGKHQYSHYSGSVHFNGIRGRWCLQVTVGADFAFKFPDTTSKHTAGVTQKCVTPPITLILLSSLAQILHSIEQFYIFSKINVYIFFFFFSFGDVVTLSDFCRCKKSMVHLLVVLLSDHKYNSHYCVYLCTTHLGNKLIPFNFTHSSSEKQPVGSKRSKQASYKSQKAAVVPPQRISGWSKSPFNRKYREPSGKALVSWDHPARDHWAYLSHCSCKKLRACSECGKLVAFLTFGKKHCNEWNFQRDV